MSIRMRGVAGAIVAATTALLLSSGPATASVPAPGERPGADAARTTYEATWHYVIYHLSLYKRVGHQSVQHGYCHHDWRDDHGVCHGWGAEYTPARSYPFADATTWMWHRKRVQCPDIPGGRDPLVWKHELRIRAEGGSGSGSVLCGWVDQDWTAMYVTGGHVSLQGPPARAHAIHHTADTVLAPGQHGGRLKVQVHAADHGFVVNLSGSLKY